MTPLKILIVDDLPVNRRLLAAQLEAEGHTVIAATHGGEALVVLEETAVDLVISDILMPVMDGYRLCATMRASSRHRDLPLIFYTATYTSPADEELCLQLGANRYLRTPVPVDELLAAIEQALATRALGTATLVEPDDVLKEYSERLIFKLEQKNVELAAASDRLTLQATALDGVADAVIIANAQGKISWVNRAFSTMAGYGPESVVGRPSREISLGIPPEVFTPAFWQTQTGSAWRGESVLRASDGTFHYDEVTVTPVIQHDTITHFVAVLHDVTARRNAEERLREAHAQLQEFLKHSPAVLYALTIEPDRITPRLVTENITRLLGMSEDEITSIELWRERIHPDDRARAKEDLISSLETGASHTEYRLQHRDGSYRWVDDTRRLIRDDTGRPVELVGAVTDISERRQAQDELRESERRFRSMLANLELIAMTLDRDGRITYCNDHLLRLTGWTMEELLGRNWIDTFLPAEIINEMHERFASLVANSSEAWHVENEILTRAGKRLAVQWNNTVLRSLTGEVIGTASIGEDVTERRQLEQQMLRAQRLESLGTLAGGIAHDLNNLLMPILLGANLLRRSEESTQKLKAIDNIERSVKRGSDLVKQVLLFARGADTTWKVVHLEPIVDEVQSIINSTFPKNISVEIAIAENLLPVTGDRTQLTQVLLNLCVNARDAMPRGGQLAINAGNTELSSPAAKRNGTAAGPYVVLEVIDTGEGMSPETLERIFDPFFTTKEVGKGTGLGLSTVQGIVSSHGGFVNVDSAPDEGTTFRVLLPAHKESVIAAVKEDVLPAEPPRGNGETILVVDDDATVLSMTEQTLKAFGYEVIPAEDGAQAIGIYARRAAEIALVLTDMSMPIVDGETLINALHRADPGLPMIAATGNIATPYLARLAKSGVASVLEKPYTADQLVHRVAEALASRP